jgi:hypothetical protein
LLGCAGGRRTGRNDDINLTLDQFRRHPAELIRIPFCEFPLNDDILSF